MVRLADQATNEPAEIAQFGVVLPPLVRPVDQATNEGASGTPIRVVLRPLVRPADQGQSRARDATGQISLAQARHFDASSAFGSLQNGQVFVAAAVSSLMNIFEIC